MTMRMMLMAAAIAGLSGSGAAAQTPDVRQAPAASSYIDPIGGMTLSQAIAAAIEQEPALQASRAEIEAARAMRQQAGLRPNPALSVMHQIEPSGTDRQTRIELQWPLDLFRKTGRVAVAEREIDAVRHAVADRERVLAGDVRRQYGEVAAAARELEVASALAAATGRQHDLIAARVEEGANPALDRDMLRVEVLRLASDVQLHAARVEEALFELKRLLGLPAAAPLRIRDTLESLMQEEREPLPAGPTEQVAARPDVQEAAARVALAEARIDRERREGRADVTLFGSYMRMDAGFMQRGFTPAGELARIRGVFHYLGAGARVTLPIRNRNQGAVAAAEAGARAAEATAGAVRLAAEAQVASARARDARARRAIESYSAAARVLAARNLDVVRQAFELGRATVFDVLAEQRRYLDTERAYISALREAYEARQALRLALGDVR